MWAPLVLLGLLGGLVVYERRNRAPSVQSQPKRDPFVAFPPTPGVWSVIVLGPDGSLQARSDFPDGAGAAHSWIARDFDGAVIAPGSTFRIFDPTGNVTGQGGR